MNQTTIDKLNAGLDLLIYITLFITFIVIEFYPFAGFVAAIWLGVHRKDWKTLTKSTS